MLVGQLRYPLKQTDAEQSLDSGAGAFRNEAPVISLITRLRRGRLCFALAVSLKR